MKMTCCPIINEAQCLFDAQRATTVALPFTAHADKSACRGAIRSAGALPVAIFLPTAPDIGKDSVATVEAQYAALLTETGFVTLRAPGVFAGHDPDSLRKFDHYNPLAHRLVAEALEGLLVSDPRVDLRGRAVKAGQPANP